ncbi:MAG: pyridoxal-phosphate dependent enzyme [Gammaproteobacteria bacterium]|jgi:threonine dehydratase|nr:pyridoxal-phosphate dependent enzyme [Gammaproteobacteria bacterium]
MTDPLIQAPNLDDIRTASELIAPHIVRTPILRLNSRKRENEIYLKLENLQPIGVFKVRSMGNILLSTDSDSLKNGVYTASSGNAGIGLAWMAEKLGLEARVYAPESGPQGKLSTMREFGAHVEIMGDDDWWQIIQNSGHPDDAGFYVDAVRSPAALAGNATMGLEIIEQLPDVDSIIVPFGGGGVACGIASAIRALKPDTKMIVAEAETAAPVTAALKRGEPVTVETRPSFISGAGAPSVLEEMWPLVKTMVDDTIVLPVAQVVAAVRLMFEQNHVVAEGAGALPVAAALSSQAPKGKTVCVVTGGNIDLEMMSKILSGKPL